MGGYHHIGNSPINEENLMWRCINHLRACELSKYPLQVLTATNREVTTKCSFTCSFRTDFSIYEITSSLNNPSFCTDMLIGGIFDKYCGFRPRFCCSVKCFFI